MVWVCSHLGHLFKYTLNYYKKIWNTLFVIYLKIRKKIYSQSNSQKKDPCYTESQNLTNDQKQHQLLLIKKIYIYLMFANAISYLKCFV